MAFVSIVFFFVLCFAFFKLGAQVQEEEISFLFHFYFCVVSFKICETWYPDMFNMEIEEICGDGSAIQWGEYTERWVGVSSGTIWCSPTSTEEHQLFRINFENRIFVLQNMNVHFLFRTFDSTQSLQNHRELNSTIQMTRRCSHNQRHLSSRHCINGCLQWHLRESSCPFVSLQWELVRYFDSFWLENIILYRSRLLSAHTRYIQIDLTICCNIYYTQKMALFKSFSMLKTIIANVSFVPLLLWFINIFIQKLSAEIENADMTHVSDHYIITIKTMQNVVYAM